MASSMIESLMCVWGSPGARASSGGPGREMSKSVATLGGDRRESLPPVNPGDGGGTPFCKRHMFDAWDWLPQGSSLQQMTLTGQSPMATIMTKMHVPLTSGTLCWKRSASGSSSGTGVEEISILSSTEDELSSWQGLPGMIPADLAARSMAPERVLTEGEDKGFVSSDKHWQRLTKC